MKHETDLRALRLLASCLSVDFPIVREDSDRLVHQAADEIQQLQAVRDDPEAHVEYTHGASGMCCQLRRQAVGRAEVAENQLANLRGQVEKFIRRIHADGDGDLDWSDVPALLDAIADEFERMRDAYAEAYKDKAALDLLRSHAIDTVCWEDELPKPDWRAWAYGRRYLNEAEKSASDDPAEAITKAAAARQELLGH